MKNKPLENNKPDVTPVSRCRLSPKQPYSQPFWLKEPHDPGSYNIPDQTLIGRADILPEVTARFDFTSEFGAVFHHRGACITGPPIRRGANTSGPWLSSRPSRSICRAGISFSLPAPRGI